MGIAILVTAAGIGIAALFVAVLAFKMWLDTERELRALNQRHELASFKEALAMKSVAHKRHIELCRNAYGLSLVATNRDNPPLPPQYVSPVVAPPASFYQPTTFIAPPPPPTR